MGVTGSVGAADFTIDYYTIDVDDYFNAVSTRDVSSDLTAGDAYTNFLALDAAGVAGANTIGGVNCSQMPMTLVSRVKMQSLSPVYRFRTGHNRYHTHLWLQQI